MGMKLTPLITAKGIAADGDRDDAPPAGKPAARDVYLPPEKPRPAAKPRAVARPPRLRR